MTAMRILDAFDIVVMLVIVPISIPHHIVPRLLIVILVLVDVLEVIIISFLFIVVVVGRKATRTSFLRLFPFILRFSLPENFRGFLLLSGIFEGIVIVDVRAVTPRGLFRGSLRDLSFFVTVEQVIVVLISMLVVIALLVKIVSVSDESIFLLIDRTVTFFPFLSKVFLSALILRV
jgi:hypothetical protein